jgi:hypothetical protein
MLRQTTRAWFMRRAALASMEERLRVNLRAEAAPEVLADALRAALPAAAAPVEGLQMALEHLEFFRPGKPVPTHRIGALSV